MQYQHINIKPIQLFIVTATLASVFLMVTFLGSAKAAPPYTKAFVRLDNLTATTTTNGRVCFEPSTTQTINTVVVTFPTTSGTDYSLATIASGNWTVNTSNLDSLPLPVQTALPAAPAAATSVVGKVVTFTLTSPTSLTSGTLYCFNFGDSTHLPVTTSSAGATETTQGTVQTYTNTPTLINQTTFSESIISNNQVVVSATVPPFFTFALSGNTDSFATNLISSTHGQTNSNITITIGTNAATGWVVWAKDVNANCGASFGCLWSATAAHKIAGTGTAGTSASALFAPGAENYGLGSTINTSTGTGTMTESTYYNGATANFGGTLSPTFYVPVVYSNGPTGSTDIVNVYELATVSGSTPAASDYTDTISYTGAGQF